MNRPSLGYGYNMEYGNDNHAHKWWGQSPTSLGTFESCPLMFKEKYLLKKYPFVETEASRYGNRFHKAVEDRLGPDNIAEPPEFAEFRPTFDAIRAIPGKLMPEVELAVDKEWKPVPYKAWGQKELGCKIDVLVVNNDKAKIIDWKTGKRYDDPLQIDINALMVFANFPEVQLLKAGYLYTKTGEMGMQKTYFRSAAYVTSGLDENIQRTRDFMSMRITKLKIAFIYDRFLPKKNGLCKAHCPVLNCQLNGRYEEWLRSDQNK